MLNFAAMIQHVMGLIGLAIGYFIGASIAGSEIEGARDWAWRIGAAIVVGYLCYYVGGYISYFLSPPDSRWWPGDDD